MAKNARDHGRSFTISLDPRNYLEFDGIALDLENQKVLGLKDGKTHALIGKSTLQYSRDRKKGGKKVLHKSPASKSDIWFNSNRQLLDYDHLIAIDTNTHLVGRSTVSITAAFHLIPRSHNSKNAYCHYAVLALVEMWNIEEKPENVGWWQILQAIEKVSAHFTGDIGLIVDSDLGNHDDFNSGKKPIIGDYYLPKNVQLIYASDRGGPEHLSTKMIRYCHELASDLYKEENLILNIKDLHKCEGSPYSHIRQWDVEQRSLREFLSLFSNR